jgi:hypothetical protein
MSEASNPFPPVLRQELIHAKEQGQKITERKSLSVLALLGLGSLQLGPLTDTYQLLFIVPLIALCFDVLELEQKFCVRRIGAFLEHFSDNMLEREWESYVNDRRGGFSLSIGEHILSLLAYLAPMVLLFHIRGDCLLDGAQSPSMCSRILNPGVVLWFASLFAIHILGVWYARKNLRLLRSAAHRLADCKNEDFPVDL